MIETEADATAQAAGHLTKIAAVGVDAEDAAGAGIGDGRSFRLAMDRPVAKVIGPAEIAVVQERVAVVEIEVAFRSPGETMTTVVNVERHSPNKTLRLNALPFRVRPRKKIEGGVSQDIKIVSANLNAGEPGIGRETVEFMARLIAPFPIRFVDEERFTAADEQPARRIGLDRGKRFIGRTVDQDSL